MNETIEINGHDEDALGGIRPERRVRGDFPKPDRPEVAAVGRSNVGKSGF